MPASLLNKSDMPFVSLSFSLSIGDRQAVCQEVLLFGVSNTYTNQIKRIIDTPSSIPAKVILGSCMA